ncbi:MAG: hypothetical protein ABW192_04105, partial [Sphingobium sp.]
GRPVAQTMRMLLAAFDAPVFDAALASVAWTGLAAVLAMRSARGLAWPHSRSARGHDESKQQTTSALACDAIVVIMGGASGTRPATAARLVVPE